MNKNLSYITLVVTAAFAVAPVITPPFSGFRPDQLPFPQIDPPIQPEGYAFAVWGLIYSWLVVSAVFGVLNRDNDANWDHARRPLIISLAIGVPWLAIANISAIWATVTIALMAVFAILAMLRAPKTDRWWLGVPVSIYAGWLTAASWVSLASTTAGYGLLTDQLGWAYIGIIGALTVAAPVFWVSKAPGYALTVVWALVGIIVANRSDLFSVTLLALIGVVALLALVAWTQAKQRKPTRQYSS